MSTLGKKLAALLRAMVREPFSSSRPDGQTANQLTLERPTPVKDRSLPLDPRYGWGFALEPAEESSRQTTAFIEQLALEAYLNEPDFRFSQEELEPRFLAFFDRLVRQGTVKRHDDVISQDDPSFVGPKQWIKAQQIRIDRLQRWWQQIGGPDIEARIL